MARLHVRSPLACVLACTLAAVTAAQSPEIVTDVNQIAVQPNPSSDPMEFAADLFSAFETSVGREPFSDSSAWDIRPGPDSSNPREFTPMPVVGGLLWVFSACTATQGRELVILPPSGDPVVVDIHRGVGSSNPVGLTYFRRRVYFSAKNSPTNVELWVTDGTAQGTVRVMDINPGQSPSNPRELTSSGLDLYFVADDGSNGREVWRTDGTSAGTQLAGEVIPGPTSSSPESLTVAHNRLYFVFDAPLTGKELARIDGGQLNIIQFDPGTGDGSPRELTAAGNKLFLLANRAQGSATSPNTEQLWWVDSAGTTQVIRLFSWSAGSAPPGNLVGDVQGAPGTAPWLFLTASNSNGGRSLHGFESRLGLGFPPRINSTLLSVGTHPRELAVLGGNLYVADRELYQVFHGPRFPGSPIMTWTWLMHDFRQGGDSMPTGLQAFFSRLSFAADDGIHGNEPWRGTLDLASGNVAFAMVRDVNSTTSDADPEQLTDAYGTTYFAADDGISGVELWRTDGTAQGTAQVMDIQPGPGSSNPERLTLLGNHLFLVADDGTSGPELWVMDLPLGTPQLLADIAPGLAGSDPEWLTVVDDGLLFCADDGVHGRELWRTNGTAAGTVLVQDIRPGAMGSSPRFFETLGRIALFAADDGVHGEELWRSNGVGAGTSLLLDIDPGSGSSIPNGLVRVGQTVWFAADDGSTGFELWSTNGTTAGTSLHTDIRNGAPSSHPIGLTRVGADALFFFADDGHAGRELWSVGSSGAYMVADVNVGTFSSNPGWPTAAGDRFFFTADDAIHGDELWVSDGTAAGTRLTRDILPSYRPAFPANLFASGGRKLWFTAQDSTLDFELWESDGTQAGTRRVADLRPGPDSSLPGGFVLSRGAVLFSATDGRRGRELWRLDPGASVQEIGVGCARSTVAPTLVATDPVVGSTMDVTGITPAPGVLAWLLLSDPLPAAVPLPIPGGLCHLHVQLNNSLSVGPLVLSSPIFQVPIRLPNLPGLEGAVYALQAAWGPTSSPLGVDVTNALVIRISSR